MTRVIEVKWELNNLFNKADELHSKIQAGQNAIKQARKKGKDVGNWESVVADLETQLERIYAEISRLSKKRSDEGDF